MILLNLLQLLYTSIDVIKEMSASFLVLVKCISWMLLNTSSVMYLNGRSPCQWPVVGLGLPMALLALSEGCLWFPLKPGGCLGSGWWWQYAGGTPAWQRAARPVLLWGVQVSSWLLRFLAASLQPSWMWRRLQPWWLLWWVLERPCPRAAGCAPASPYLDIVANVGTLLFPRCISLCLELALGWLVPSLSRPPAASGRSAGNGAQNSFSWQRRWGSVVSANAFIVCLFESPLSLYLQYMGLSCGQSTLVQLQGSWPLCSCMTQTHFSTFFKVILEFFCNMYHFEFRQTTYIVDILHEKCPPAPQLPGRGSEGSCGPSRWCRYWGRSPSNSCRASSWGSRGAARTSSRDSKCFSCLVFALMQSLFHLHQLSWCSTSLCVWTHPFWCCVIFELYPFIQLSNNESTVHYLSFLFFY